MRTQPSSLRQGVAAGHTIHSVCVAAVPRFSTSGRLCCARAQATAFSRHSMTTQRQVSRRSKACVAAFNVSTCQDAQELGLGLLAWACTDSVAPLTVPDDLHLHADYDTQQLNFSC